MSNLLEKASILTTPTAYNDGKLLSVKPAPYLGSELVTNGTFDTDSNWNKQTTNWTIVNGYAVCDGLQTSNSSLFQDLAVVNGSSYRIDFTITNSLNNLNLILGATTIGQYGSGTHSVYVTKDANASARIFFQATASNNFSGSLDNVSVKQVIDGDFDFTRNSSATRVASNGLIEDVQILSGNLVTNGDFSQEGAELVTNGDFATDSDWDFGGDWELVNGTAEIQSSTNSFLVQSNVVDLSVKTYKLQYEVVTTNGSNFRLAGGNSAFGTVTLDSATIGIKTAYLTTNGTKRNLQFNQNAFRGSIDNVSVKEVGQDWTLGTGWSIGDDKAISDATQGYISQNNVGAAGVTATYKVQWTQNITAGARLRFFARNYNDSGNATVLSLTRDDGVVVGGGNCVGSGTFTGYISSTNGYSFKILAETGVEADITNISTIEITDDTNLPRIDYTGGEGHWLFEPQSTNLIPYSEDFSTYSAFTGASIQQNYSTSPDGLQNATKLNFSANSFSRIEQVISGSFASQTHTVSLWARCASNTEAFRLKCTNRGYVDYYSENKTATTQWQKFSFSATFGSTSGDIGAAIANSTDAQERSIEIFGFQVEANKSFSTSYIPTNGSTVTRLQDAAFGAGSSDLINSTEGVLYAEVAALGTGSYRLISLNNGSAGNSVTIGFNNGSSNFYFRVASSNGTTTYNTFPIDYDGFNKIALKYKSGDISIFANGTKKVQSSGTFAFASSLNKLNFDYGSNDDLPFFGKNKCVAVFKEALTDAELECLTT